mgnify:CR=1 FL=1
MKLSELPLSTEELIAADLIEDAADDEEAECIDDLTDALSLLDDCEEQLALVLKVDAQTRFLRLQQQQIILDLHASILTFLAMWDLQGAA